MKHSIISQQQIDTHNSIVKIQLKPENQDEIDAIKNLEVSTATETEKEMIENYLHFQLGLGNYSVVKQINQEGNFVTLQIFI